MLSQHDALPIFGSWQACYRDRGGACQAGRTRCEEPSVHPPASDVRPWPVPSNRTDTSLPRCSCATSDRESRSALALRAAKGGERSRAELKHDRKTDGKGESVAVRVDHGGRRSIK